MTLTGVIDYLSALYPSQNLTWFTVEYDENSIAWLIDQKTNAHIPLVHGMQIAVAKLQVPEYLENPV